MRLLKQLDRILAGLEISLVVITVATMVVLTFLQVILRNLFSTGIYWADPLLRHMVLWVTFLGASLSTGEKKHIRIDVLLRLLKGRSRAVVELLTALISIFICGILAYAGWRFVMSERDFGDTVFLNLATWKVQIIIPVGFAIIAFRFLLNGLEQFVDLCRSIPAETGKH